MLAHYIETQRKSPFTNRTLLLNFAQEMLRYSISLLLLSTATILSSCKPHGKATYYADGQVKSADSLDAHGQLWSVAYFRPDGTLERIHPIQNGKIHGVLKRYDAHEKLVATEEWANGHQQGVETNYYPNGKVSFTKTMRDSTVIDTSRTYYPNGEIQQVVVRSSTGRLIDFGAWHPNGLKDTRYARVLVLSDQDSIRLGEDYAFEIRLGNRHSNMVTVSLKPIPVGLDSITGTFASTRYIIRQPSPGRHIIRGRLYEQWARKGSDTIWTNVYPIEHTFYVAKNSNFPIAH